MKIKLLFAVIFILISMTLILVPTRDLATVGSVTAHNISIPLIKYIRIPYFKDCESQIGSHIIEMYTLRALYTDYQHESKVISDELSSLIELTNEHCYVGDTTRNRLLIETAKEGQLELFKILFIGYECPSTENINYAFVNSGKVHNLKEYVTDDLSSESCSNNL